MPNILTFNSGSSSLRFALFRLEGENLSLLARGHASGIGPGNGRFQVDAPTCPDMAVDREQRFTNHDEALDTYADWASRAGALHELIAVGHRVVHGGIDFSEHCLIDSNFLDLLNDLVPMAPLHIPPSLTVIERALEIYPHCNQVACFDTVFHRHLPRQAMLTGLPYELFESGIRKYGFHGLSYEYVSRRLENIDIDRRIIIAHLGNGCSMAAIKNGKCVETSMGFSPAGGFMMSTRCGDLDPGILTYLLLERSMTAEEIFECIFKRSGLLGISGTSGDMKTLLASTRERDRLAVDTFCYQARKCVASFSAALAGLDMLVFTGGIGERSARIRQEICRELAYLGIFIDEEKNKKDAEVISSLESRVKILVIPTDEEQMIAEHTARLATRIQ